MCHMEWYWAFVEMLAGNIVKESRACINNGLPFEPHQNHICVFNHLCVANLALQDSIVCPYIWKSLFFVTYIKAVPFLFSKNRGVLMTTFLAVWRSATLRLSVITNSRYRVPGAWFSANLRGTSLGTVRNITQTSHFRFTSKSPIPASFTVVSFELAMAWMNTFINTSLTTE